MAVGVSELANERLQLHVRHSRLICCSSRLRPARPTAKAYLIQCLGMAFILFITFAHTHCIESHDSFLEVHVLFRRNSFLI